jgi:four helix bundle protein
MTKSYSHRNLIVWQRAQELAHQMIKLTRRLPQNWANAVLARQIIMSATSIGANIAEGHGRYTPGAHGNHLSIAKGSAAETDSWLDSLRREGYLTSEEEALLHNECMEIMAILKSKILDLERLERERSTKAREERTIYNVSDTLDEALFPFVPEDYE